MYPTIDNYNLTQGFHVVVCYINDSTNSVFMYLFFASVLIVLTVGSYLAQRRLTGFGNFTSSFMAGSFITLLLAIVFRLLSCPFNSLVNNFTLGFCIGLAFISFMWLAFSEE